MYYHASPVKNIEILTPRISNHNIPLIYFSDKRENVLVYLSNAVEKFCKEQNFEYNGFWYKWGAYGFKDGILCFEEYYPNALEETYKEVSGYIYYCNEIIEENTIDIKIPNAHISSKATKVNFCEFIEDAYEEILLAEKAGKIHIIRYEQFIEKRKAWLERVIEEEYSSIEDHPEYRFFLKNKFGDILRDKS